MKCNICGREFVSLGVHLRHKHKVDPDDYKEEHGMLRAAPLVDKWLSDRLKDSVNNRLKDPDYKDEVTQRCLANAKNNVGKAGGGTAMSSVGRKLLAERGKVRNDAYLIRQSVIVAEVLREKGTMLDVRKATGSGPEAARKMAKIAGIEYSRESAKIVRDARAAATTRAKAVARVALVLPYLDATKSAAEMFRLTGISKRTYQNWIAAGLISRHPSSRLPKQEVLV